MISAYFLFLLGLFFAVEDGVLGAEVWLSELLLALASGGGGALLGRLIAVACTELLLELDSAAGGALLLVVHCCTAVRLLHLLHRHHS